MAGKKNSRRHKRGGSYSSASTYGSYVNGSQNAQYNRVFSTSGAYGNVPGNNLIGQQGQNAIQQGVPDSKSLTLIQSAGSKGRGKRGGIWGQVINQAVVPVALLGMQQNYGRKRTGGRRSRGKNGGFLGEIVNQAIVPVALLGMQNTYRRKRTGGTHTRKHRRH